MCIYRTIVMQVARNRVVRDFHFLFESSVHVLETRVNLKKHSNPVCNFHVFTILLRRQTTPREIIFYIRLYIYDKLEKIFLYLYIIEVFVYNKRF